MDYSILRIGYDEVFGKRADWDMIQSAVHRLPTPWFLGVLGWMSRTLGSKPNSEETQKRILYTLFDDEAPELWAKGGAAHERVTGGRSEGDFVFFTELVLVNLWKAYLLLRELDESEESGDARALGIAFLAMNSLIREGDDLLQGEEDDAAAKRLSFLVANSIASHRGHELHDYARWHLLYLTDSPELKDHVDYVDLPARFEHLVSLPHEVVNAVAFSLTGHFLGGDETTANKGPLRRLSFDKHVGRALSTQEIEAFEEWAVRSVKDLQDMVRSTYELDNLAPFHILPFAERPFVRAGGHLYCPSALLAQEKLQSGVFHAFLHRDRTTSQERERFLRFCGVKFERYVHHVLSRIFPPGTDRLVLESELQSQLPRGAKVCDAGIRYPGGAVLVEFKAARFPLAARSGLDWVACKARLDEILVDGMEQILATAQDLPEGFLYPPTASRSTWTIIPLVVTAEHVRMTPHLAEHVHHELTQRGVRQPAWVAPFQVLTIAELELAEVALARGTDMFTWLRRKAADPRWRYVPFLNFLHLTADPALDMGHNTELVAVFDAVAQRAVDFLEHRLEDVTNGGVA